MKARRNIWLLFLIGFLWWLGIGFTISEVSGLIGRISDPAHAEAAEKRYQEATENVGHIIGLTVAAFGTWAGVLPGTRKRLVPLEEKDIEHLEKLAALQKQGVLSEAEFAEHKALLLDGDQD